MEAYVNVPHTSLTGVMKCIGLEAIAQTTPRPSQWKMYPRDYTLGGHLIVDDYGEPGMIGKLEIWSMFETSREAVQERGKHLHEIEKFMTQIGWLSDKDGEMITVLGNVAPEQRRLLFGWLRFG